MRNEIRKQSILNSQKKTTKHQPWCLNLPYLLLLCIDLKIALSRIRSETSAFVLIKAVFVHFLLYFASPVNFFSLANLNVANILIRLYSIKKKF